MKRIFYNENLSGSGLVTGRAIRFIRDSDGAEIDLSEIGQTGKYLADPIEPGVWSVWDVTDGSPGVDLDQKVDVLSSTLVAQQITFPVPPDGNVFLAGDETFKELGIANIDGLGAAIAAKQDNIATGNAAHAYFGNKAFRAITLSDLPTDIKGIALNVNLDAIAIGAGAAGGDLSPGSGLISISEIAASKSYAIVLSVSFNDPVLYAGGFNIRLQPTGTMADGALELYQRFLVAVGATGIRPFSGGFYQKGIDFTFLPLFIAPDVGGVLSFYITSIGKAYTVGDQIIFYGMGVVNG